MYSTCIFCHGALGANEVIEHFPVGRRLVFDAARGRLWVVCRSCERWNLTPLEERWEAIEECERAFAGTKLRVSTDQIGLARLREGTTLVRIGKPQRPEMAAWRYGDQFGRRRRRSLITGAAWGAAVGGLVLAGPVMGLVGGGVVNLVNVGNIYNRFRTVARVHVGGSALRLDLRSLSMVELRPDDEDGFELKVPFVQPLASKGLPFAGRTASVLARLNSGLWFTQGSITLRNDEALRVARVLLPHINANGGRRSTVNDALRLLEADPTPSTLFAKVAAGDEDVIISSMGSWVRESQHRLGKLSAPQRLALEMCLHEDDERRALEGELAELARRWQEAEEIAAISDGLFVPNDVSARVEQLKRDDR